MLAIDILTFRGAIVLLDTSVFEISEPYSYIASVRSPVGTSKGRRGRL